MGHVAHKHDTWHDDVSWFATHGATQRAARRAVAAQEIVEAFMAAVTERTRLAMIDTVSRRVPAPPPTVKTLKPLRHAGIVSLCPFGMVSLCPFGVMCHHRAGFSFSGLRMPFEALTAQLERRGVHVLVDAAQ